MQQLLIQLRKLLQNKPESQQANVKCTGSFDAKEPVLLLNHSHG